MKFLALPVPHSVYERKLQNIDDADGASCEQSLAATITGDCGRLIMTMETPNNTVDVEATRVRRIRVIRPCDENNQLLLADNILCKDID